MFTGQNSLVGQSPNFFNGGTTVTLTDNAEQRIDREIEKELEPNRRLKERGEKRVRSLQLLPNRAQWQRPPAAQVAAKDLHVADFPSELTVQSVAVHRRIEVPNS